MASFQSDQIWKEGLWRILVTSNGATIYQIESQIKIYESEIHASLIYEYLGFPFRAITKNILD